ncbi:hypothetical protein D1007_44950 [Hordeum vulgare]|nr:hypothetical protein D1007_44950 [Hordeum vulgare]
MTQHQGGGRTTTTPPPPPPHRHRRSCGRTRAPPVAEPLPEAADGHRGNEKDPVDDFFRAAKKPTVASVLADPVADDVQAAAEAAVAAPLDFGGDNFFEDDVDAAERVQLDAFSPTLSAATTDCGKFNRATPSAACTM